MNNEIFYSYQPLYLRKGLQSVSESKLCEIDLLAELLENPDENLVQIEKLWNNNADFFVLTNNTQNIYHDTFQ